MSSTCQSEFRFPVEGERCRDLVMAAVELEVHTLHASLKLFIFASSSENWQRHRTVTHFTFLSQRSSLLTAVVMIMAVNTSVVLAVCPALLGALHIYSLISGDPDDCAPSFISLCVVLMMHQYVGCSVSEKKKNASSKGMVKSKNSHN